MIVKCCDYKSRHLPEPRPKGSGQREHSQHGSTPPVSWHPIAAVMTNHSPLFQARRSLTVAALIMAV